MRRFAALSALQVALAVLAGLGAAGAVAVVVMSGEDMYTSQALLVIDNPRELARAGDDGTINKLTKLRFKYASLAETATLAGPVADELDLPLGFVLQATTVTPVPESLVVRSVARSSRPDVSVRLANAVARQLQTFVQEEHEANAIPPLRRFQFDLVQEAQFAPRTAPDRERAVLAAAISGVAALVLSLFALRFLFPQPA